MQKQVRITEILERVIDVDIDDDLCESGLVDIDEEAISLAKEMYYNEEIVLDSSDFIDRSFEIVD